MQNNIVNYTANMTPIEIALGIDEKGMTTARKLYEFMELDKKNYARWSRNNIVENEFAEEKVDYFPFVIEEEREKFNPNPTTDYRLTAKFAKKLSMTAKNEKGEQAREYFIRAEDKLKEVAINRMQLSPELQMFMQMGEAMARQELEQKRQAEKLSILEENQKVISQTFTKESAQDFKAWVNHCLSAIAESDNFRYIGNRQERHKAVRAESYKRLNDKKSCRLDQRVETEKGRAAIAGASQSRISAINKLTIIESDKALKPIYETVIREMMIAYCVEVA
jgi:anti-repressor protein